jgi:hypothetical protein
MGGKTGPQAVAAVADVYLHFAATHPSLYGAMSQLPIDARFAEDYAETELHSGFNARGAVLGNDGDGTATELLRSALTQGLVCGPRSAHAMAKPTGAGCR